ncbi:MAG TPA: hypothetical protein VE891_13660 [Allosphingosinicella sp.]|nr:hypothetical protein [Allosphingosinicella sp.]
MPLQAAGTGRAGPQRPSDLAYRPESAIRVIRKDRLILGPETRICVETTLDPEAKRIVEASGQRLYPGITKEITHYTTGRMRSELHYSGWTQHGPRDRIIAYINHPSDSESCFDRPDTIRIRQSIVRGRSARGYGVRLEARQGSRAYILAVDRPYAVVVDGEIRGALDFRATRVPGTDRLYWDPVRDCAVMADMFILHLLKGGRARA